MEISVAGHQPLAEKVSGLPSWGSLQEVLVMSVQRVSNVIRVIEQEYVTWANLEMDDVSIIASELHQKSKWVTASRGKHKTVQAAEFRPWGIKIHG
ncbi:MAG: hypothetical protein DMF75_09835 [Acidobacteria bacterium]|nr:MAG: hypothetical protein DMF75_09835 [Acidobacteriota bacterium]